MGLDNKKGQMGIVWLFVIFIAIIVVGFVLALLMSFFKWGTETITPIASDLGMIDNTNVSQIGGTAFGVLNTIAGILPMLVGFAYVMLLMGCIALVMSYRGTQNPLFIGLFLAFMILTVLVAIFVSNAYEDLYSGSDEMALQLQDQTILSYLILYSPYIITIIGFICGIFLFVGKSQDNYGVEGGF